MNSKLIKNCESCKFCTVKYADGYIFKDWSGKYNGNSDNLPLGPDRSKYWTYIECSKNAKGLKFINLMNDCREFKAK